jgi:hypothetical protein
MSRKTVFLFLIVVLLFISPACGDDSGGSSGEKPSGKSETFYVDAGTDGVVVPEGKDIVLTSGWLAKEKKQVVDFFNASENEVFVNGIPVNIKDVSLSELEKTEDGYYFQYIYFNIGDLPAGSYDLRLMTDINKEVYDGWDYYGPDTDYPSQETYTSIVVGAGQAPAAQAENGAGQPSPAEEEAPAPAPVSCSINSSFKTEWNTQLCETFDSGTTLLWTGRSGGTSARVEDGQYILDNSTSISQGFTTGFTYPVLAGSAPNHMISVDGTMESIFKSCAWGVYLRSTSNEVTYFFMITNEGRYMLTGSSDEESRRYLGNIDAGGHNSIIWDGTNNITAIVDGKHIEFYINGKLVLEHEAINATNPYFGLIVWGGEGVDALNRFDNLLVRVSN